VVAGGEGYWEAACGSWALDLPAFGDEMIGCVYDHDGSLEGAYKNDPARCPRVGRLVSPQLETYLNCSESTTCWVENGDPACDVRDQLPPACIDYVQSDLPTAFEQVSHSKPTLTDYLSNIVESGASDYFTALTGCGFTALESYGLGASTAMFGKDGSLVGFDFVGDASFGACNTGEYSRGLLPSDACAAYHACRIAPDFVDTGVVCDCPCPSSPPSDGSVETSFECIAAAVAPACGSTEQEESDTVDAQGGLWETGCGYSVSVRELQTSWDIDGGQLTCVYDVTHGLVGAKFDEPLVSGCPGVSSWTQGTLPLASCTPRTCWQGPAEKSPPGVIPCSDL
jgi:hypothetical protein